MLDDLKMSLPAYLSRFRERRSMRELALFSYWRGRAGPSRCDACGKPDLGVMLVEAVWRRIARREERLCDACIRRRLGRPFTKRDLRDCGWNEDRGW